MSNKFLEHKTEVIEPKNNQAQAKANKSKQTLQRILEDEKDNNSSSNKLPRSKSGLLNPYKSMSLHIEHDIHVPTGGDLLHVRF